MASSHMVDVQPIVTFYVSLQTMKQLNTLLLCTMIKSGDHSV